MLRIGDTFSGFAVNDLRAAKQFYSEVLGFPVQENEMGILELKIKQDHKIIIYPKDDHQPAVFTILNIPVSDIDEAVDFLAQKGVQFEQYEGALKTDKKGILRGGEKEPVIAWFRDPAGNILSIIQEN